jgi:hypoxanthine-DNA glycosylase
MTKGLPPVIEQNSQILIIGSFPSELSLKKKEYYGNPANQFWEIIYSIFESEPKNSYPTKITFLKEHAIALWDVIYSCKRVGSSDSKINNIQVNDFSSLLRNYHELRCICFNGTKAYTTFKQRVVSSSIVLKLLPSSSPANAKIPLELKTSQWAAIVCYLK